MSKMATDAQAKGAHVYLLTVTTRNMWTNPKVKFNDARPVDANNQPLAALPADYDAKDDRIERGTPVRIVDEPVLAGWQDGVLYLEVHPPLAEDTRDLETLAEHAIAAALARAGKSGVVVDAAKVAQVIAEKRGLPFPVLASTPNPKQFLASARVVENTAPPSAVEASVEATARAD